MFKRFLVIKILNARQILISSVLKLVNVLAITAGIAANMKFGVNAHTILIARGVVEIKNRT